MYGHTLMDNECMACMANCEICSSTWECTICNSQFYWNGGSCEPCNWLCDECVDYAEGCMACSTEL